MELRTDYSNIKFANNGRLKLLIIVGTRPEIIRLAAVINKCRKYFDTILAHTGQNYDYNLNGVFFKDLKLQDPEVYMDAVGDDLGSTMGNIINASYKLMVQTQPDAVLVLGDTNSCLSVIGAKRLHIPIFHMEAAAGRPGAALGSWWLPGEERADGCAIFPHGGGRKPYKERSQVIPDSFPLPLDPIKGNGIRFLLLVCVWPGLARITTTPFIF